GAGTHTIAVSRDGIHWTGVSLSGDLFDEAYDVAWNGTVFVVGGSGANKMAISSDGLEWSKVETPFSAKCTGVAWTGTRWLAYGSGGNRTAYSTDKDAQTWQATSVPNITDLAGETYTDNPVYASSTQATGYEIANLADANVNTQWRSTTDASGQYVEVQYDSAHLVVRYTVANSVSTSWQLFGSNDGTTWSPIGSAYQCVNNVLATAVDVNVGNNTVSYSRYRLVFYTSSTSYHSAGLWVLYGLSSGETPSYMKPIITRNAVLGTYPFPGGTTQIYTLYTSDLGTSSIPVSESKFSLPTGVCYDGMATVLSFYNGNISYFSNTATNTTYSPTSASSSGLTHAYAICYNGKRIVVGGQGG
ncbi:discoidin domain-containing protein, partial [bacterium]|nr:discoidin domain-containing protein [bacterium]